MFKKLALAALAVFGLSAAAVAGYWAPNWPAFNTAANTICASYGNNSVCNQYTPAGTTLLTGSETLPMDVNGTGQPFQQTIAMSYLGTGFGGINVLTTTGTTAAVVVPDNTALQIYAGAGTATYTSFKLPVNPMNGQKVCLANAGSGILTLTAVAASANNYGNTPTVTGVTPTSLPVATAVGTAGTVTLSQNCWAYVAAANNTGTWYRVQ